MDAPDSPIGFDDASWNGTYAAGNQLNRYPADGLVSLAYRLLGGRDRATTPILEVGCGAGNNAWFFAREGFPVTAVDGSTHCLEYAKARFDAEGLQADFRQMTFLELGTLSGPYALIRDREALAHNHWKDLTHILPMIAGLMDENSYFVSFFFAADHPDKCHMGRCDDELTWLDPQEPVFGNARWVTLPDEAQLRELFAPFTIVDLYKKTLESSVHDAPYTGDSEWIVICKKK